MNPALCLVRVYSIPGLPSPQIKYSGAPVAVFDSAEIFRNSSMISLITSPPFSKMVQRAQKSRISREVLLLYLTIFYPKYHTRNPPENQGFLHSFLDFYNFFTFSETESCCDGGICWTHALCVSAIRANNPISNVKYWYNSPFQTASLYQNSNQLQKVRKFLDFPLPFSVFYGTLL